MKGLKRKFAVISLATSLILSLGIQIASAKFYALGTLEFKPVDASNWFVEYLKPGTVSQKQVVIANFSSETKKIGLYSTDATDTSLRSNFQVNTAEETSKHFSSWITLPVQELTLKSGESKILSVNFQIPQKAGVGLHSGAIIARELDTNNQVVFEKGIRVYLNVTGLAIANSSLTNIQSSVVGNSAVLQFNTLNQGTTDANVEYGVMVKDMFNNSIIKTVKDSIDPDTNGVTKVETGSLPYGIYTVSAVSANQTQPISVMVLFPAWTLYFAAFAVLMLAQPDFKRFAKGYKKFKKSVSKIRFGVPQLQLEKSVSYIGAFLFVVAITVGLTKVDLNFIKTQLIGDNSNIDHYNLTIKWGNFGKLGGSTKLKKNWEGTIKVTDGQFDISEFTNFESNDSAQLSDDKHTINYRLQTGPDNDGLVIKVTPTGSNTPQIAYLNTITGVETDFSVEDFINSGSIFTNGFAETYIKTDKILAPKVVPPNSTEAATPDNQTASTPELQNLFTQELPSTPDALSSVVLSSDYVQNIQRENSTATVETDVSLIKALASTPDVAQEIAATPELNFIFVPSEKVSLPPTEFSFDKSATSSQSLGTMIFVQNKNTSWNTYVSSSNFSSLSGNFTIPATSITIVPGKAKIISGLSGTNLETGAQKTLTSTSDKSTLVNVKSGDTDTVFVLNPSIQVHIPPGTRPGRYSGSITITTL